MNVLPVTPYTPPSTHRPYLVPHLSHQPSTQLKPKKVFPQFQDSNRINSFQLLSLILKTKRFHFTFKKKRQYNCYKTMLSVGWWVHFIVPQLHLRVLLIQLWFWNRQCQNSGGRWTCSFLCVPQTGPLLGSTKMTLPDTLVTYQQASSFLGTSSLNSVSLRKQISWRQPWAGPPLENTVALVTKQPLVTDTF